MAAPQPEERSWPPAKLILAIASLAALESHMNNRIEKLYLRRVASTPVTPLPHYLYLANLNQSRINIVPAKFDGISAMINTLWATFFGVQNRQDRLQEEKR